MIAPMYSGLQIVVAFRMLPEVVWNLPPMGTVNLHGSLLPQYRGAAPINWAIINGEKETGVTSFMLKHEIDTGDILLSEKILIADDETAGTLHDKMKEKGASVLLETIIGLAEGKIKETPQENFVNQPGLILKHAPKIFTETCNIDWSKSCEAINNLIRGLSPYPAAFTKLDEKKLKIFTATIEKTTPTCSVGLHETDNKTYLRFACNDGYIYITDLQLEGKKRMKTEDFLRGYRFN